MRTINSIKDRSLYSFIFDESSPFFKKGDRQNNLEVLKSLQAYYNRELPKRGYVLLNEILSKLELPLKTYGYIVGWNYTNEDSIIDFGLFDYNMPPGYDDLILVQPNIDGVIFW